MTENTVYPSPEQDVQNNPKEKIKEKPLIKSETEYSQEGHQTDVPKTKDAETEAHTEVEDVHVTAEVYSSTDLPSSYKTKQGATPKPGKVIPEKIDDQYVVLRASRSKGVNTVEESNVSDCLLLKCIFPPINIKKKKNVQANIPEQSTRKEKKGEADDIEVSHQLTVFRCKPDNVTEGRSSPLKCKDSCPNLVINQTSPSNGTVAVHTAKPEEHGDNGLVAVSTAVMVGDGSRAMGTETQTINVKSYTQVNLGSIEEQEEPDAPQLAPTKEDKAIETDTTICVNYARKDKSEKKETRKQISDIAVGSVQTDAQDESDTSDPFIHVTQDAASDTLDMEYLHRRRTARSARSPSIYRFETGTIISDQSVAWVDSLRGRKCYKEISARASDCFCRASGTSDSLTCWTKMIQSAKSSRLMQCEAINSVANCSMSSQTICGRPAERYNSCNRCLNNGSRPCDDRSIRWRDQSDSSPSDCWSSRNGQSFGKLQEAFVNQQLCRINNSQANLMSGTSFDNGMQNRSSRNNACNQYYLNCWCNNGYSFRNPNMMHCTPSSHIVCQAPQAYYYSYRTWY